MLEARISSMAMANPGRTIASAATPTPHPAAERVRAALEKAGSRYTQQRAAVYAYLEQVQSHPTAEEVYKAVQSRLPCISLATVYNALEALVEARLANKLTYGDGSAPTTVATRTIITCGTR